MYNTFYKTNKYTEVMANIETHIKTKHQSRLTNKAMCCALKRVLFEMFNVIFKLCLSSKMH